MPRRSPSSLFWPYVLIIGPLLVLVLASLLGLRHQRQARLGETQQQAQHWVEEALLELQTHFSRNSFKTEPTVPPIVAPQPQDKTGPRFAELENILALNDNEKRTKLEAFLLEYADSTEALMELTPTGLPVMVVAAGARLEAPLGLVPAASQIPHSQNPTWAILDILGKAPCLLQSKLQDRLFELALIPETEMQSYRQQDEIRSYFQVPLEAKWKELPPGPYLFNHRLTWLVGIHEGRPDHRWPSGRTPNCVALTEEDIAKHIGTSIPRFPWLKSSISKAEDEGYIAVSLLGKQLWPQTLPPQAGKMIAKASDAQFAVTAHLLNEGKVLAPLLRLQSWMIGFLVLMLFAAFLALWSIHRTVRREQRLNELKSQFVSSVSHELRAPVGSLRLMAEALHAEKIAGDSAKEFHRLMAREASRLSSLVENVLDFARIEQGRKAYQFAETDVPTLLHDIVALIEPIASERDITITLDCQPLPQPPQIDAAAIQQAVINLLDNAVKFSPNGSTINVIAQPHRDTNFWALSVSDQGPGIPASEHERIFQRFYRLGNELRRETQGAGIGLSIVQHVVIGHGGRVELHSQPGQGANFILILPFSPPTLPS